MFITRNLLSAVLASTTNPHEGLCQEPAEPMEAV